MGRSRGKVGKELQPLQRIAEDAGWEITPTRGGHFRWESPEGKVVHSSGSSSDWRVVRHVASDLQAAGLVLPDGWDGHTRGKRQPKSGSLIEAVAAVEDVQVSRGYVPVRGAVPMTESTPEEIGDYRQPLSEGIAMTAPVCKPTGQPYEPEVAAALLGTYNIGRAYDAPARSRAWAVVSETADAYESEEPGQHVNDLESAEEKGTAVARIGEAATWSGLNMKVVCSTAQEVFDALRGWVEKNPASVEGRSSGRWLMRRPIKGVVCGKLNDAGISDEAELNLYTQAMYRLLQDTNIGTPALIKVQAHTPSRAALWSLADAWTAPQSIVPMFLSRRGGTAMTAAEKRVSDYEANEDGSRSGPVVVVTNDNITITSPSYQPDPQHPDFPWKCLENGCGLRFATTSALGGHTANHHSRLTQPSDDAVEAAVARVIRKMLGSDDLEAEITYAREVMDRQAQELATTTELLMQAEAERDEAVAALRLLLTDFINPKVVEGVIDAARYLSD